MSKFKDIKILIGNSKKITLNFAFIAMLFSSGLGIARWYANNVLSDLSTHIKESVHQDVENLKVQILNDNSLIKEKLAALDDNDRNLSHVVDRLKNQIRENSKEKVSKNDMYHYMQIDMAGIYHALDSYKKYCCTPPYSTFLGASKK